MVIVWGETLWDRFPDGDRLGGAPANVAWHLAWLGTPVALVTRVGADADGERALALLARRGVDTSLAQRDPDRATGEVTVTVEAGEPRYRLVPGRAWEHLAFTDELAARLPGARALVFGTLAQRSDDGHAGLAALLAAASPRVLRVCDPNLRTTAPTPDEERALSQALAAADVLKLGEREAAQLTARTGAEPIAAALARGARLVALTRGADGSRWHAPGLTLDVAPCPARPGGDNVGCGDAYTAAVVHGLLAGWPWPRIARLASRLGALVAGHRGATPSLDDATRDALLAEVA